MVRFDSLALLLIAFHCHGSNWGVCGQIVTAGTYFVQRSSSQSNEPANATSDDASNGMALRSEMFQCSRENRCRSLGRREGIEEYSSVVEGEPLAQYSEILEKTQTGFQSCEEVSKWGIKSNMKVDLSLRNGSFFTGYCNMVSDNGGWLVIQRRVDLTDFYRNWTDYVNGFGNVDGSFLIGLKILHWATQVNENMVLRIEVTNINGSSGYAKYSNFKIGSKEEKYRITFGTYEGDIGDSLGVSNGSAFSTPDRDNDGIREVHCGKMFRGGWWSAACFAANLNNDHVDKLPRVSTPAAEDAARMSWYALDNKYGTIRYSAMMIKPYP